MAKAKGQSWKHAQKVREKQQADKAAALAKKAGKAPAKQGTPSWSGFDPVQGYDIGDVVDVNGQLYAASDSFSSFVHQVIRPVRAPQGRYISGVMQAAMESLEKQGIPASFKPTPQQIALYGSPKVSASHIQVVVPKEYPALVSDIVGEETMDKMNQDVIDAAIKQQELEDFAQKYQLGPDPEGRYIVESGIVKPETDEELLEVLKSVSEALTCTYKEIAANLRTTTDALVKEQEQAMKLAWDLRTEQRKNQVLEMERENWERENLALKAALHKIQNPPVAEGQVEADAQELESQATSEGMSALSMLLGVE